MLVVKRRTGVTRSELLVLMFLLFVATGLLAKGVQQGQEEANRLKCADNLKRIALATLNYETTSGRLPPGYLGPKPNVHYSNIVPTDDLVLNASHVGLLRYLLPFLGQEEISRQLTAVTDVDFIFPPNSNPEWWAKQPDFTLAYTALPMFRCPSTPNDQPHLTSAFLHTATVNDGSPFADTANTMVLFVFSPPGNNLARTNYLGVAGILGRNATRASLIYRDADNNPIDFQLYEGVFGNRTPITSNDITDGTSNTLLIGETIGGSSVGPPDITLTWMCSGALGTLYGLGRGGIAYENGGSRWWRFSSFHPAGVQFAMADGSLRVIAFGTTAVPPAQPNQLPADWFVLQQLAGRADGGP